MPTILIVAGPNGAGKTTFATRWIAQVEQAFEFVNADEIARLMPATLSQGERDMRAGRFMLGRLEMLLDDGADIVLETTLSSLLYARRIPGWRAKGYECGLIYLRLPSVEASIARVAHRVQMGGHSVPEGDLRRRFGRSLGNLPAYKALVDTWEIWDSMDGEPVLAERSPS
jgi:predicted ABC-type ATPase